MLSTQARQRLIVAMTSKQYGTEVANVIDAGGGSLSAGAQLRLKVAMASKAVANDLIAGIGGSPHLSAHDLRVMIVALARTDVGTEVFNAIAAL